jgi:hypothetical protein
MFTFTCGSLEGVSGACCDAAGRATRSEVTSEMSFGSTAE